MSKLRPILGGVVVALVGVSIWAMVGRGAQSSRGRVQLECKLAAGRVRVDYEPGPIAAGAAGGRSGEPIWSLATDAESPRLRTEVPLLLGHGRSRVLLPPGEHRFAVQGSEAAGWQLLTFQVGVLPSPLAAVETVELAADRVAQERSDLEILIADEGDHGKLTLRWGSWQAGTSVAAPTAHSVTAQLAAETLHFSWWVWDTDPFLQLAMRNGAILPVGWLRAADGTEFAIAARVAKDFEATLLLQNETRRLAAERLAIDAHPALRGREPARSAAAIETDRAALVGRWRPRAEARGDVRDTGEEYEATSRWSIESHGDGLAVRVRFGRREATFVLPADALDSGK